MKREIDSDRYDMPCGDYNDDDDGEEK